MICGGRSRWLGERSEVGGLSGLNRRQHRRWTSPHLFGCQVIWGLVASGGTAGGISTVVSSWGDWGVKAGGGIQRKAWWLFLFVFFIDSCRSALFLVCIMDVWNVSTPFLLLLRGCLKCVLRSCCCSHLYHRLVKLHGCLCFKDCVLFLWLCLPMFLLCK
jgi:hypothetical protein